MLSPSGLGVEHFFQLHVLEILRMQSDFKKSAPVIFFRRFTKKNNNKVKNVFKHKIFLTYDSKSNNGYLLVSSTDQGRADVTLLVHVNLMCVVT